MLIDDNSDDNFFHARAIRKSALTENVMVFNKATNALTHLDRTDLPIAENPDLIFLDINMPGMNGWEFLEHYGHLHTREKRQVIVIMLTTSEHPDDIERAKHWDFVQAYQVKPLSQESIAEIVERYFGKGA
jgi:CheY-like chemotaxis protein